LLLSSISWLGHESILAHQLTRVVMSAAAVPLIGLAANEVAGARAGLAAAAIAAVYPNFWSSDAYIMSESLYVTMVRVIGYGGRSLARFRRRDVLQPRTEGIGA
jgi:hypothetical protein